MEKSGGNLRKKHGKKTVFMTLNVNLFLERLEMMTANKVMSGFKTHTPVRSTNHRQIFSATTFIRQTAWYLHRLNDNITTHTCIILTGIHMECY